MGLREGFIRVNSGKEIKATFIEYNKIIDGLTDKVKALDASVSKLKAKLKKK